jgi:leader peptidase (prepilin peptidase) / N-methyltransferase
MSLDPIAGLGCALVTAALCAAGPALLRRLPEPTTVPAAAGVAAPDTAAGVPGAATSKVAYRDLAARPGLSWRLSATGATVGAVVGARLGVVPALVPCTYVAVVGVLLAYVDAQTQLLPTRIIAPSYAVVVSLIALAAWLDASLGGIERAGLAWLVMGGFYFALWFVHPSGIGYGDVRLAGLLAPTLGYLGWGQLVTGMYAGFLLGGIGGAALTLTGRADRRRYPFGPFMVLGALGGAAFGGALAHLYTAW